ncbi:uncharacterized protein N7459_006978 [Penicillium hispanicum]|uniref:uncharacterized protein n=1 Tax=Penicillium hispanicum TaxID=1080232 RepID=UPI00253F71F9|nr:uncharacterized protein N7459_006978 [Penicillium hispanicum]KAJ5578014.1 hypothetical protein N7459_006978 [Penicillium hispanicum]
MSGVVELGLSAPRRHALLPSAIRSPSPSNTVIDCANHPVPSAGCSDLDSSVSPAFLASTPPLPSKDPRILRDESRLAPSLLLSSPPSGDSSPPAAGSSSQRPSPRSITLEPPPLPFLSQRRTEESLTSSPDNRRAGSSVYYTTAWGSPYAAPSTRRLSLTLSQYAGIDHISGESSPASSIANNPEILQASVPVNSEDLAGHPGGQTIRDFTQDWINQYLSGQPRTERSNWLSDDSGSEAPSFFTAQNHLADDLSDDWLGLEDNIRDHDLLRTPTLSDFVGRRAAGRAKVKRNSHKRAETLRQEDFWGFAYDKEPSKNIMSDSKELQASAEATSPVEKPLPPPPTNIDESIKKPGTEEPSRPDAMKRQASDINRPSAQTPRRRKKLAWKGKACIIELPMDDQRGSELGHRLMTPADVQAKLKRFEDEGYDVRGFTIGATDDPSEAATLGSLSRPLYPDPAEVWDDSKKQQAIIHFPDKAVWDSYVNHLQEEKLRALGVSFGDDEPQPSVSPASASINPTQTPFPGLGPSPPIPTTSAGSNPLGPLHPFSPQFGQPPGAASAGIASLASPASQFSVQTPFMGIEQNLINGYPFQFQPTPPAQGSMTPQSLINIRQAHASTGPGALPNFNSMLSPISPMHEQASLHHGFQEKDVFEDRFGNVGHEDGPPFPAPKTPVNAPDHFHASNVEIAHPTPRGHGHNLSETLQRGLEQMTHTDYQMEESAEPHIEEDHDTSHHGLNPNIMQSRWALPEINHHQAQHASHEPSFAQHPHHFYNEQYMHDHAHEGSDYDTNPSLTGTPNVRGIMPDQPWHKSKPSAGSYQGHHSKLSASSLNVDAREFDPNSFASQPAPFVNNAFQFGGMNQQGFGSAPAPAFGSHEDLDAPVKAKPEPKPSSFKFSAASFNVDAPVFNPSASLNSNASSEQPSGSRAKIFGDIDISEITKPAKQSKAIPIVRPDDTEPAEKGAEQETVDLENGRPVPTDRHKRARRGIGHAEGEARYSISTHPLGEVGNAQASITLHTVAEGKENAIPEASKPVERRGTPMSEADTCTLFDYKNEGEAARSNVGSPGPSEPTSDKEESIEKQQPKESSIDTAPEAEPKLAQHAAEKFKEGVLSPTAPAFEFKPAVPAFVPTAVQPSNLFEKSAAELEDKAESKEPKPAEKPPVEKKAQGGLMASRFATDSPPKSQPPPPTATSVFKTSQMLSPQQNLDFYRESDNESPDDEELNAVMDQLNEYSDAGIERQHTPLPTQYISESVGGPTKEKRFASAETRSEAPSPSPGGGQKTYKLNIPRLGSDIDAQSNATFSPQKSGVSRIQSPVRQLITKNGHVSDWNDMISSGEDEKFFNRNRFFDRRINDLVGSAIDDRLGPMERALGVIQQSVASIATGTATRRVLRSTSAEMEDSDADDEDDEEHEGSVRARSPQHMRERKLEMLKSVVMEALVTHDLPHRGTHHSSHSEIAQLKESIAELQALTIKKLAQDPVGDMREILEETLIKQLAQQTPRLSEAEEIGADSLMLQIDGLKSMLRLADERADQEYKDRRDAQDSVAELQRLLKVAEEDAARHSAAAENAEARLLHFKEEKIPHLEKMQFRTESLSEESETLKVTIAELSSKNIALEGTLDEYRVSSDHFRRQLDTTKSENKSLHETVDHLRTRIEDSMVARQNLTEKFDRLQVDMATATADVARDQAAWRKKEEEQNAKYNELRASHARELRLREQLELEVADLAKQEREAVKIKFLHEQSQQENARLEDTITYLRAENHELQLKAARFEREFNEARESSRVEIQRTRASIETDLEAANSQVNIVRAELEAQIIRLQSQMDNVRMDADTSRERYELLLEESNESKISALTAAKESRELALEDQRKTHERVLNDLRERHARALHNSSEDRQRSEAHTEERLALADDRAKHLQDRVQHLEEKLEIAQSAARAAAEAARSGKASPSASSAPAPAPTHSSSPSMSFSKGSQEPEKISPQALRESILVLQDQLQQRETRIEELEQENSAVDKDAPNKIKERDSEINWLRELLGVRIDDLQDIIKTLSQPTFNQHAVRDAAIRLKANLQMQQQERERTVSGQGLPSLPSISDLAASPRALPLAAAAAWGNWRKGRENATASASDQTPSKSSNAGAFLSGLLTPPSSHVRQNAANASAPGRSFSESRPLRGFNSTIRRGSLRQEAPVAEPPKTPPLLRRSSYDHDAEPANYEEGNFADDIESTVGGMVSASPKDAGDEGPFGPQISAEAEQ